MGYLHAGRVGLVPKGDWDSTYDYSKLNLVTHDNKVYVAKRPSRGMEPKGFSDQYWMLAMDAYLKDFVGATETEDGAHGLVPQPLAGEQTKTLAGNGHWGYKLETDIINNNGTMGYTVTHESDEIDDEEPTKDFVPFMTYGEAVQEALIGTAEPSDVLIGKSFTNKEARGLAGAMKDYSSSCLVVTNGATDSQRPAMRKTTFNNESYYEVSMPTGYWEYSLGNSGALIPAEEKTVTPSTVSQIIEPSAGKVLTKVTIGATNAPQSKTVTAGTDTLMVVPDSGYYLSSVTVKPTPSQTKTVTATSSVIEVTPDSGKLLSSVTVKPKTSQKILLGTVTTGSGTFNVSGYSGYENFTVTDNFYYEVTSVACSFGYASNTTNGMRYSSTKNIKVQAEVANNGTSSTAASISYNASTGVLTLSGFRTGRTVTSRASIYYTDGSSNNHTDANAAITATVNIKVYLLI